MKNKTLVFLLAPIYLIGLYMMGLGGIDYLGQRNSPKINSEQQLVKMLEDEKSKLECRKNISAVFCNDGYSQVEKKENGNYLISLNTKLNSNNLSCLRHELYHIYAGHCEKNNGKVSRTISYLFKEEPAAILYGNWGINYSKSENREDLK